MRIERINYHMVNVAFWQYTRRLRLVRLIAQPLAKRRKKLLEAGRDRIAYPSRL